MEEKYKKAMMTNAQLDNEKHALVYKVELLKDQLEEQEETLTELQRQYKDKSRVYLCIYSQACFSDHLY
jgi:nucleoid-associated protein YejK